MKRPFQRFRVVPTETGMTLRNLLIRRLAHTDRERASALIHAGGVYVNRLRVRLGTIRVVAGERITVYLDALSPAPLDVNRLVFAYRDPSFVIVDKPAGVPVEPTKSSAHGTLTQALGTWLEKNGVVRPYVGVVHRLDRRASGLVLLTTRSAVNKNIHQLFVQHAIERIYRIRVRGRAPAQWTCEASLVHLPTGGVRIAKPGQEQSERACTRFRRLEEVPSRNGSGAVETLVEVELETGKTHQIRAHAQHTGFSLIGERRYAETSTPLADDAPLCLFAHTLRFTHPENQQIVMASAVLPSWARQTSERDLAPRWEENLAQGDEDEQDLATDAPENPAKDSSLG